jgi:L-aminopeptidase/D-esterase-like protein
MISSGTEAIGHGGVGERSVGAGSPRMESVVKALIRDWRDGDRPCREWWAVMGTVFKALEELGSWGLGIVGAGAGVVGDFFARALK